MYLYGASGHGQVIKEIVEAQGGIVDGFVDDNLEQKNFCDRLVVHKSEGLSPMIISIGDNKKRKEKADSLTCQYATAIHPSAIISPSAKIGEGTVIMPGAIINAGARIGKHCIINTGASVDHGCVIGDFCHIAPHAALCGQVHVGDGTLIGVGAAVIPCKEIGKWCIVGAGAVVTAKVDDNKTVVGVPAKERGKNNLSAHSGGG